MKDLSGKVTGSQYTAPEFDDYFNENKNQVESSGQALTEADAFQLAKAVANYAADGDFYTDSGSGTAYVLTPVTPRKGITGVASDYRTGTRARFIAANSNTDAATVNINAIAVKDIKDSLGGDLIPGQIAAGRVIEIVYNGTYFVLYDDGKGAGLDSPFPPGTFRGGLCNQDAGDPAKDMKFEAVTARGVNDFANIYIPAGSSLIKQLDANWAEGNNQGGFPSGLTLTPGTWYHCFYIAKPDSTTDCGYDTSLTATNLLADATGYTDYIYDHSIFYTGGAVIQDHTMIILPGGQRIVRWTDPVEDLNITGGSFPSVGVTQTLTLTVPVGLEIYAHFGCALTEGSGGANRQANFEFWSPIANGAGYANVAGPSDAQATPQVLGGGHELDKITNTSSQIKWKATTLTHTSPRLRVYTQGWML